MLLGNGGKQSKKIEAISLIKLVKISK